MRSIPWQVFVLPPRGATVAVDQPLGKDAIKLEQVQQMAQTTGWTVKPVSISKTKNSKKIQVNTNTNV